MRTGAMGICVMCLLLLAACQREKRDIRPSPTRLAIYGDAAKEDALRPGGPISPQPVVNNPYNGSAYDISEGQRLFNWYNCSGCHANGGGGIGPPLIKQHWTYGGEPANLFDTIVKGRPNGMPAWGGRIPEYQVWQIIAFIRSMNGEQPRSATASRQDSIETNPQNIVNRVRGKTK
ncbi:MAG TPA: c-type cytochrome [Bryobacteraceae bacterium]|nr:c-type cytochrome [Bryobacteraceae bacterium]